MADIWARNVTYGGTYPGEKLQVTFSAGGISAIGLLATQVQIQAQRPVGQMVDLQTGNLWFIASLPQPATVQLAGIIIDAADYKAFSELFGDACAGTDITITVTPPQCATPATNLVYTLKGAILSVRTDGVDAQNLYYIGRLTLLGASLEQAIS